MTLRVRNLVLPGGLRLEYVERGDPGGVPVIFLHGLSDSWRSFEPVLSGMPERMHALAVSLRGHGDSDRPGTGYRDADFADDVAALMTALGLAQAVIVGHSMSGSIAQRFALDHPSRTLGLVLIGARVAWRDAPGLEALWNEIVAPMRDPVDPGFVREFQESTLSQPVPPGFLSTVVQESLKLPAYVWQGAFRECLLAPDHRAELERIQAPVLLLCGDRDAYSRAGQDELVAAIPGAQLKTYARAGHALHWEEPERFVADLAAFVDSRVPGVSARRSGACAAGSSAGSARAGTPSGLQGPAGP